MIPVQPAPEPAEFDLKVRRSGLAWLAQKGLPTQGPLPANTDPSPYWPSFGTKPSAKEL